MPHAMNDTLCEHISAFLDGELPEREIELLLKRLEREPELRATLSRYAAIGECLRGEPDRMSRDFTARVSRAVALEAARGESAAALPAETRGGRWLRAGARLAGGLAVAATVAVAAILLLQREPAPTTAPESAGDMQLIAGTTARDPQTVVLGTSRGSETYSYTVPTPAKTSPIVSAARLTDYVFAHSGYSSPLGRRNVLSAVIASDPTPMEPHEGAQAPAAGEPR